MKLIEGDKDAATLSLAIITTRWNPTIVDRLFDGACKALKGLGMRDDHIDHIVVPGAFEIPTACAALIATGKYDALIALGCVIRGETAHFDYVAGEAATGIGSLARSSGTPIAFGVLTTNSEQQAIDRAGGKYGNVGAEAAEVAVEMANLVKTIRGTHV